MRAGLSQTRRASAAPPTPETGSRTFAAQFRRFRRRTYSSIRSFSTAVILARYSLSSNARSSISTCCSSAVAQKDTRNKFFVIQICRHEPIRSVTVGVALGTPLADLYSDRAATEATPTVTGNVRLPLMSGQIRISITQNFFQLGSHILQHSPEAARAGVKPAFLRY